MEIGLSIGCNMDPIFAVNLYLYFLDGCVL